VAASLRHELARKAIHLASAVVPIGYAAGLRREVLLVLLTLALLIALGVEAARRHVPRVRGPFERAVGGLLREHERTRLSGATWMATAYLLAVVLFPPAVAVAAMLAVALGDASAAIVGRWVGTRAAARAAARAPGSAVAPSGRKTWAGTIACAVATALGALFVARLGPGAALACAVAAALAERPRLAFDDNVRVALAAGGGAQLASLVAPLVAPLLGR
jgi:dolichol kinase